MYRGLVLGRHALFEIFEIFELFALLGLLRELFAPLAHAGSWGSVG